MNRTAAKTLALLELVLQHKGGLTLTEVAQALKMPVSSAHSLVTTLVAVRYLQRDAETRRYQLGLKVLELGQTYLREMDLFTASTPLLGEMCRSLDCMGSVAVFDPAAAKVLSIAEEGGAPHVRMMWRTGRDSTLHCGAPGKVFLASRDDAEVDEILSRVGMTRFTPNTITDLPRLHQELALIRQQGYACDRQEVTLGLGCLAAPIVVDGMAIGALAIRVPSERFNDDLVATVLETLQDTADSIADGVKRLKHPQLRAITANVVAFDGQAASPPKRKRSVRRARAAARS